jgi:hypothetical protein
MVGLYPTINLMSRRLILRQGREASLTPGSEEPVVLSGISAPFETLSRTRRADYPRVTHPCATLLRGPKPPVLVRLACVRHAASVHSEPGSNSPCIYEDFSISIFGHARHGRARFFSLACLPLFSFQRSPARHELEPQNLKAHFPGRTIFEYNNNNKTCQEISGGNFLAGEMAAWRESPAGERFFFIRQLLSW